MYVHRTSLVRDVYFRCRGVLARDHYRFEVRPNERTIIFRTAKTFRPKKSTPVGEKVVLVCIGNEACASPAPS